MDGCVSVDDGSSGSVDSVLVFPQVDTAEARIDLIKTQKKYKEKISGASGDYYLGEALGQGGFAAVKAGIHAETGLRVAAKIMDAASAAEEEHKREIVAMAALKHPNVVGLTDVIFKAGAKKGTGQIYIMLEQMSGGELFSRVVDNGCLDEKDARFYFRQILEGMLYCHSRQLCHRDMKLENLLLDASNQQVKITVSPFTCWFGSPACETKVGLMCVPSSRTLGSPRTSRMMLRAQSSALRCMWRPRSWQVSNPHLTLIIIT